MKDLFKGCWTIPNLLSLIRILLIPVFAVLFYQDQKIAAVAVLALSGLSDMLDGKIARKYNQISALGKVLDPVADKLTQITIAVMLLIDFRKADDALINAFGWVFLVFLIKEAVMIIGGLVMLLLGIRPGAAEIFGKLATAVFYFGMTIIIAVGPEVGAFKDYFTLPPILTGIIVVVSAIMTIVAFASYMPETFRQFKEYFDNKKANKTN